MKLIEHEGEFQIVDFNEQEAYMLAIRVEKDGIRFYRHLAEKERDLEAKKMIEFLAVDEAKHLKFFEECLREQQEQADEDTENDLLESVDNGVFAPYEQIEDMEKAVSDVKTALRLAVKIEGNSIHLYEACRDNARTDAAKAQLTHIIEEEHRHRDMLQAMLAERY